MIQLYFRNSPINGAARWIVRVAGVEHDVRNVVLDGVVAAGEADRVKTGAPGEWETQPRAFLECEGTAHFAGETCTIRRDDGSSSETKAPATEAAQGSKAAS